MSRARCIISWGFGLVAFAGLLVWWPMLSETAPGWPRALPPALSVMAGLVWLFTAWPGIRAPARAGLVAVNLLLVAALARDAGMDRRIRHPDGPTLRIAQWTLDAVSTNAALFSELERELPHVVLLHHPPPTLALAGQSATARRLRLNFALRRMAILVISRFPLEPLTPPQLQEVETIFVRVQDPAGAFYLLALDANGASMNAAHTRALASFIRDHPEARPLVLACGNARDRTDAVWRPVRAALRPAYEQAGYGWPYSTPSRLPLFARDHLWVSDDLIVNGAGYRWSRHSPHLRQYIILSRPGANE